MLFVALMALGSLVVLAAAAILGISAWVAHKLTLVVRLPVYDHPSRHGLAYEEVQFPSYKDKVPLRGWYLPAQPDVRCIIFAAGEEHHRNSPGIRALELGRDMVQRGFSVLLFDFRGRGESGGRRGSAGDRERWDLLGAIAYVEGRSIPRERIGLLGFSMGAAVALMVAAKERRIPAIVADSGFVDYVPYLKGLPFYYFKLPGWFAFPIVVAGSLFFGADFGNVRPIKVVRQIAPRPVLFIHGENDHVVPYQESQQLYAASVNETNVLWTVPGAGHVHSYARRREEYVDKVAAFFQRHVPNPTGEKD